MIDDKDKFITALITTILVLWILLVVLGLSVLRALFWSFLVTVTIVSVWCYDNQLRIGLVFAAAFSWLLLIFLVTIPYWLDLQISI